MKAYDLDLSAYNVDVETFKREEDNSITRKVEKQEFPIRQEMYEMLRIPGVLDSGMEIVDAVTLARRILSCEDNSIELTKDEMDVLRKVMNKLIKREHNPQAGVLALGGPRYEELIMRVFTAEEK
jgi:hypothetical protein